MWFSSQVTLGVCWGKKNIPLKFQQLIWLHIPKWYNTGFCITDIPLCHNRKNSHTCNRSQVYTLGFGFDQYAKWNEYSLLIWIKDRCLFCLSFPQEFFPCCLLECFWSQTCIFIWSEALEWIITFGIHVISSDLLNKAKRWARSAWISDLKGLQLNYMTYNSVHLFMSKGQKCKEI